MLPSSCWGTQGREFRRADSWMAKTTKRQTYSIAPQGTDPGAKSELSCTQREEAATPCQLPVQDAHLANPAWRARRTYALTVT